MAMIFDAVTVLNLLFCIIIVGLGYWAYRYKGVRFALYIAISFGLFAITHIAILMGFKSSGVPILVIRSLAYLVIIYALYLIVTGKWDEYY